MIVINLKPKWLGKSLVKFTSFFLLYYLNFELIFAFFIKSNFVVNVEFDRFLMKGEN